MSDDLRDSIESVRAELTARISDAERRLGNHVEGSRKESSSRTESLRRELVGEVESARRESRENTERLRRELASKTDDCRQELAGQIFNVRIQTENLSASFALAKTGSIFLYLGLIAILLFAMARGFHWL